MDLRQLRYFVTVAEEHSVTRAATRLHLTQPPLTVQLSRLERELGVPLLIRHRRGVDLTDAGRYLSTHARRLLAEVDALAQSVRQLGEGRSGRLALAFDSATAWALLPQLLERFRVDRPDVVLDVTEETADGVLEAVRLRRTDLGLVHLPPPTVAQTRDPQLDFAVVHREPLVAVLPAALATQHGERADLAALAAQGGFQSTSQHRSYPGGCGGSTAKDPTRRDVGRKAGPVRSADCPRGDQLRSLSDGGNQPQDRNTLAVRAHNPEHGW